MTAPLCSGRTGWGGGGVGLSLWRDGSEGLRGFPPPSPRGQALRGNDELGAREWRVGGVGMASGGRGDDECGEMGVRVTWVPACAGMTNWGRGNDEWGCGNGFHCGEMGVRGYVGSRLRGNDGNGVGGMMSRGVGMGSLWRDGSEGLRGFPPARE